MSPQESAYLWGYALGARRLREWPASRMVAIREIHQTYLQLAFYPDWPLTQGLAGSVDAALDSLGL